ncbi:hypothetical protein QP343_04500 [Lactobacillus jensenii]|jgi:hypothetical protein|uniref:Uncharacterized protein n=2 Tax=Lactobacillus jensenii TaxID=109790 RepID=A0A5N1IEU8_LACJE|nr:hypothetical protein [Lactobacillus jensenii]EEQ67954.1 hypothetical protein LBJG_00382 [Lactobacillus jensenii 1153]ERJ41893.1 hypothetical protein N581_05980 [Lactobacillus jensenii MD IIE-70(2)]MCT7874712.1 hypothetical protein [Lactobacillus iners]APT13929.1 hypothetical protein BUE77_00250 [Lactobacillus jensenii]EEQ23903.1 hypothetical protein LACJE0001_0377 [Lactobacillus jensenii 269-3]
MTYKLKIDDEAQTIQDVHVPNKEAFKIIKFSVLNNHMEGWKPNKVDIEELLDSYYCPDPEDIKVYEEILG